MNDLQREDYEILKYFDAFCRKHEIDYSLFGGTLIGAVRHQGFIPWDDDIDVVMKREDFERFEALFLKSGYLEDGYTYQSRTVHYYQAHEGAKIRSNTINVIERMPSTQKGNYGPWVDIFPYDNIPDDPKLRREQYEKVTRYNFWLKKFLLVQVEPTDQGVRRVIKKVVQVTNETFYKLNPLIPYLLKKRRACILQYNDTETKDMGDHTYLHYKNYDDFSANILSRSELSELIELPFEGGIFKAQKAYHETLTRYYGDYMLIPDEEDRKVHKIERL